MIGQAGTSPEVDCDKLDGRLREICEGTSGLPETGEGNTREAYLKLWAAQMTAAPPPSQRRIRLGDWLAWLLFKLARGDEEKLKRLGRRFDLFVAWLSRGRIQSPAEGCNCDARRAWLNALGFRMADRLLWIPKLLKGDFRK